MLGVHVLRVSVCVLGGGLVPLGAEVGGSDDDVVFVLHQNRDLSAARRLQQPLQQLQRLWHISNNCLVNYLVV